VPRSLTARAPSPPRAERNAPRAASPPRVRLPVSTAALASVAGGALHRHHRGIIPASSPPPAQDACADLPPRCTKKRVPLAVDCGKLSVEEKTRLNQIRALFECFDVNKNGEIDFEEFHDLASVFEGKKFTLEKAKAMFSKLDTDESASIDINEFVDFVFRKLRPLPQVKFDRIMKQMMAVAVPDIPGSVDAAAMYQKFQLFDSDKNGLLQGRELQALSRWAYVTLRTDGKNHLPSSEVDLRVQHMMDVFDIDKDGEVSFAEFQLCYAQQVSRLTAREARMAAKRQHVADKGWDKVSSI